MLAEIRRVIGLEATDSLLARFGGCHLRVPKKAREGHPIERVVGMTASARLSAHFGGEILNVPSAYRERLDRRNDQIVSARTAGQSVESIARAHNLTTRSVFSILSRHRSLAA